MTTAMASPIISLQPADSCESFYSLVPREPAPLPVLQPLPPSPIIMGAEHSRTPSSGPPNPRTYSAPQLELRHKTSRTWHPGSSSGQPSPSPRPSPNPSPDIRARQNSAPIQLISLPSSMSEALNQQKGPSLMRRVSQKAANKLRRRTSSTSNDADERSGPVIMRHRSSSVNSSSNGDPGRLGIQHHDTFSDDDHDTLHMADQLDGVGTTPHAEGPLPVALSNPESEAVVGISIPEELQNGTIMTRVTRKKKTQRTFKLDANKARVSWDSTKQTSRFYVDDMRDVRTGANARNYREELQISFEYEGTWITITYVDPEDKGKLKLLHVIAPNVYLFNLWTKTLESIHRYRTEMMAGLAMQGEKFVDAHWKNYMATQKHPTAPTEERLTFDDVDRLCRRLHINCSKQYLKDKFKRADRDHSGYLNFQEFRRFVKLLKERDEILELWEESVTQPLVGMDREEFRAFLKDVQKVDVDADAAYVDKVFRKFCRKSITKAEKTDGVHRLQFEDLNSMRMTEEAFADFLLSSSYNPPLLTSVAEPVLDRPLNEYYISSSHNTYLMGRQVRGESSVEGYIRVLQRGCRCVEIDCWDGDDGRPIVTHGHTGTSQVLFSDVVSAIGKYAFLASPYPLILSLEVHCNLEQQIKMAEHLVQILGEKLVTEPFMTNSLILPSPHDMKHRILVKVKGSSLQDTATLHHDFSAMDKKANSSHTGTGKPLQGPAAGHSSSSAVSTSESEEPSSGSADGRNTQRHRQSAKIATELGSLGVYCRGQKFKNFALPESKTFNHVFSFQEKAFVKFCKDPEKKAQMEKHNFRYLMRVYPSGFRLRSSNFDPLGFWRRGVQMAALNWQTYDLGLQLNEAMFAAAHDSTGYVLKPKCLRGAKTTSDSLSDAANARLKKGKEVTFSIKVISAQQLPRPKDYKSDDTINPFVEVEVFSADDKTKGTSTAEGGVDTSDLKGISGLGAPQKRRTKVVRDDGFHPLFREKMKFSLVTKFEDLVFIRFSVFNSDNAGSGDDKTLMATYTAKLISLQQGYRHLPLYDSQGEQYLFSTLFVRIDVNPIVQIDRNDIPERVASTMDSIKSVLSGRFSSDRRSFKRKEHPRSLLPYGHGHAGGGHTS